jgi:hypothetical protein
MRLRVNSLLLLLDQIKLCENLRKGVLVSASFFFVIVPTWAQTSTSRTGWYQYFGDHPVSEHWGIHAEGQWRRDNIITRWEQLLLRTGVNYRVDRHVRLTLGYAYLRTFEYGEIPREPSREHRIYEELDATHRHWYIDWEHRLRLEQRFMAQEQNFKWEYGDRVRYRLQVRTTLRATPVDQSRMYLAFYDEVFVKFGPHSGPQALDQNRVYGAVGVNLNGENRLEAGYLYRYFPPSSGIFRQEHALQISVFSHSPLFHKL